MPTKVTVPLLGEGVEEVTIVDWLKAEGEAVEEFEGLVVVETDKVTTEIPSPTTGTVLKIIIPNEGETVGVGTLLAWIGQPDESIPAQSADESPGAEAQAQPAAAEPAPKVAAAPKGSPERPRPEAGGRDLGFISPVVARIASQHQVNLSQVNGSGRGGRITKKDVLAFIESGPTPPPSSPASHLPGDILPHSLTRRRIAEHMVMSKRTSPHVTTLMEVDLSRVIAHRSANKTAFARDGARLTFTAYFAAATAEALRAFPMVNASWSEAGIILHPEINIGMATDLGDEGLIVPVIRRADELSLLGLARAINDLAERARMNRLKPNEVQSGTFTITNHGISGSLLAMPIINQPQCAILGVGAMQKRVVVRTDKLGNDTIAIRPMAYLTLTFDHRILDGAGADHFLAKVVTALERWG